MKRFLLLLSVFAVNTLALENNATHSIQCSWDETVISVKKDFFAPYGIDLLNGDTKMELDGTSSCFSTQTTDSLVMRLNDSQPWDCATDIVINNGIVYLEYLVEVDLKTSSSQPTAINRGQLVSMKFECQYDLLQNDSSTQNLKALVRGFEAEQSALIETDTFKLKLELFTDNTFQTVLDDSGLLQNFSLGEELFVGIVDKVSDDADVEIQMTSCIAYFESNGVGTNYKDDDYVLIDDDGCSSNSDLVTVEKNFEGTKAGFKVKAFYPPYQWDSLEWDASEKVYHMNARMSCTITVCGNTDGSCPAPTNCGAKRIRRDVGSEVGDTAEGTNALKVKKPAGGSKSFKTTLKYEVADAIDEKCKEKGCSHMCYKNKEEPVCLCPEESSLGEDGKICVKDIPSDVTSKVFVFENLKFTTNQLYMAGLVFFCFLFQVLAVSAFCYQNLLRKSQNHPLIEA